MTSRQRFGLYLVIIGSAWAMQANPNSFRYVVIVALVTIGGVMFIMSDDDD